MFFLAREIIRARAIHKFAEREAVDSQLPGRKRGPADAYRHMLGAAEATRIYGELPTSVAGEAGEIISGNTAEESAMDRHNNKIGIEIGKIARKENWTREQTIKAVRQKIIESKNRDGSSRPGGDFATWYPEKDGQGNSNWGGNPKYDISDNVEESKKGVPMPIEHMNWPNIDFNDPYHNNPYGTPPGFQPYVTESDATIEEELRAQFREDESKRNQPDPNVPAADEIDPKTGKKFGDMRTGEYASALFRKRQRDAANGNATNDNAPNAGGDVRVRAYDREGGKEHVRAYSRSKPKK
ncbi:MAG: hypothetical protein EYC62_01845 [Alphaproteobacteria bacterium]|nr:MAG: hypothetical protein EYC62_01845 [Alphaproteobacteria bacterium]